MGDKTSAIVTTSIGHPFIFEGKETLGNIGLDIDVSLPVIADDTYFKAGFVVGLGAMAHPKIRHNSTSDSGNGRIPPPGLFSQSAISPEATAVDSVHDRGHPREKSDSSALSVVQARFGFFAEVKNEDFIGETDSSFSMAATAGYSNMIDDPPLFDIMMDISFFLYFTRHVAAGISVDTGFMSDWVGESSSNSYLYFEPSAALRFEI